MTTILFIFTIVLVVSGSAFAITHMWLSLFSSVTIDVGARKKTCVSFAKWSMILSLLFALLSCLLSKTGASDEAIDRTSTLYTVIAINWLVVFFLSTVSIIIASVAKARYRADAAKDIKKVLVVSVFGFLIAALLAWALGG